MLPQNYKVTNLIAGVNKHVQAMNEDQKTAGVQGLQQDFQSNLHHFLAFFGVEDYHKSLTNPQQQEFNHRVMMNLNALQQGLLVREQARVNASMNPPQDATVPPRAPAPAPAAPAPHQQPQPPRVVHVYVHETCRRSLWYDWMAWCQWNSMMNMMAQNQAAMNRHQHQHQHQQQQQDQRNQPQDDKKEKDMKQVSVAIAIVGVILIGLAIIMAMYSMVHILRTVDQLRYMEDVHANTLKLVMTFFGGGIGLVLGGAIGASVFAAPIIGAIVGALLLSGIIIAVTKRLIEQHHKAHESNSALDYDTRFCLSEKERDRLYRDGYDIEAIEEVLRELAISYDEAHQKDWGFMFWSEENRSKAVVIDLVRQLKKGFPANEFSFNNKVFVIRNPIQRPFFNQAPVNGVQVQNYMDNRYVDNRYAQAGLAQAPARP